MNHLRSITIVLTLFLFGLVFAQGEKKVSFKNDVFPIIKAKCLPCHAEDNFNPSELSMDSYELLAQGGKHGVPFKPGKAAESLMIQKLSENPPFGDRMPLNSKKKIQEGKAVWLTSDELRTIATWIDQGAKNN
ncbi:MAG: hypothetical protein C4326_09850 [Ignavibacteria bacterium]